MGWLMRWPEKVLYKIVGLFLLVLLVGLPSDASTPDVVVQTGIQRPDFQRVEIVIKDKRIKVEIADTDEKRAFGLMYVEKMSFDYGMLFVFDDDTRRAFWMKNTLVPLDIAYVDKNLKITEIIKMQPAPLGVLRPKSYPSKKKSMFALEMNAGWYEKNKIWPGDRLHVSDSVTGKLRH